MPKPPSASFSVFLPQSMTQNKRRALGRFMTHWSAQAKKYPIGAAEPMTQAMPLPVEQHIQRPKQKPL